MAKRKTRRERRSLNYEYKQQVLELIRAGDKSVSAICKDLDLTESTVRRWVKLNQETNGIMTQNSLSETDQQCCVQNYCHTISQIIGHTIPLLKPSIPNLWS